MEVRLQLAWVISFHHMGSGSSGPVAFLPAHMFSSLGLLILRCSVLCRLHYLDHLSVQDATGV